MTALDHAVRTEDSELTLASILRRVFEQGVIEACREGYI
jgi:hypothetical protein